MVKVHEQVTTRFAELAKQAEQIPLIGRDLPQASHQQFYSWATSALNVIRGTFGKDSPHYMHFEAELSMIEHNHVWSERLDAIRGVFLGAKSDVDGGYLFDLQASISGEVFGDFVAAAKAALADGNHTVAAVLASAALEDGLKRFAISQELRVEDKTMEEVINALKSKGLVSGAQKSLLSAMPRIRNHAMHAEWSKLTPQDTGSVIGFVEQFLLTHFT